MSLLTESYWLLTKSGCVIKLEETPNSKFYTNSSIFGYLELSFPREAIIRSIIVTLECRETTKQSGYKIKWKNLKNSRWFFWSTTGNEVIYSGQTIIYEYDKSNMLTLIGKNLFAFAIDIPKDLPPSLYYSEDCSIVYTLKAVVDQQVWGKLKSFLQIEVLSPINAISTPISAEKSIKVRDHWILFKKGILSMKVDMPTNCFIPGEIVYLKINLKNFSKKKVKYLRFTFFKTFILEMSKPFKEQRPNEETLFDFVSDGIDPFKQCFYNIRFRIPKDIHSYNFKKSTLFHINYKLSIYCCMGTSHAKIDLFPQIVDDKWSLEMEGELDKTQYMLPLDQPIVSLDAAAAFDGLTTKEKFYAYYISEASWTGCLITFLQTSVESGPLFVFLHKLFSQVNPHRFKKEALDAGFTEDDVKALFVYTCGVFSNAGNFKGFGDSKFIPSIECEKFEALVKTTSNWNALIPIWQKIKNRIYDLSPGKTCLGYPPHGCNTYLSKNCTSEDNQTVQNWMKANKLEGYNTRLFKTLTIDSVEYEIRLASKEEGELSSEVKGNTTFRLTKGDYAPIIGKVADSLRRAAEYAASEIQSDMLLSYAESFQSGSLSDHKTGSRFWIQDKGPVVETYIGFIETYRDPAGIRGEFEAFVAIVNKEMSRKFSNLVEKAEKLLPLLPWPKEFEKDRFLRPDFTSLDVLTFASSGIPAGINIPNYDDIRQTEGFKNVSLGNVIPASYQMSKTPFLSEEDSTLMQKYRVSSFELQVGLHELLGHGSGKLFCSLPNGDRNYPVTLRDPITGKPVEGSYHAGDTYDSIFGPMGSSYEECRAEAVGLFLSLEPQVVKIFGHEGKDAEDLVYVNWLSLVWNGIGKALETWDPARGWLQAHSQARFVIAKVLIEAGVATVSQPTDDDLLVSLDRKLLQTTGKKAIGDFLLKLQVYKATANVTEAQKMYDYYSEVDEQWSNRRKIVLANKQPRKIFTQANTFIEGENVTLKGYEESLEGMIQSWVERFKYAESLYEDILQLSAADEHHFI